MHYYIGIDGGGTKTACLLSDAHGRIIGSYTAGPSNYHTVGVARAKSTLHKCITGAIASSGCEISEIHGMALGLSGVDRADDHTIIAAILAELEIPVKHRLIDNDAVIALAGATLARPGLVVISGTGSIAFGINQRGERRRAGGWGPVLGDEGSGSEIGRQAMVAAMRETDGRGQRTMLTPLLLDTLGVSEAPQLITLIHEQNMPRHEIAALARLVSEAADEGDEVARQILRQAGCDLAEAACAVIRELNMQGEEFEIGLAGGVLRSTSGIMAETISRLTRELAPYSSVIRPRYAPVVGALLLALRQGGLDLTEEVLGNISATVDCGDGGDEKGEVGSVRN